MVQVGDFLRVFAKGATNYALSKDDEYVGELVPKEINLGDVVSVGGELFIVHYILKEEGRITISLEKDGFFYKNVSIVEVSTRWARTKT
jgi:hypothetical protein